MEIKWIEDFIALAQYQSFSRAAEFFLPAWLKTLTAHFGDVRARVSRAQDHIQLLVDPTEILARQCVAYAVSACSPGIAHYVVHGGNSLFKPELK